MFKNLALTAVVLLATAASVLADEPRVGIPYARWYEAELTTFRFDDQLKHL